MRMFMKNDLKNVCMFVLPPFNDVALANVF